MLLINFLIWKNRVVNSGFSLFVAMLLLLAQPSYSQREADRWYFGHNCGLDFSTGEPVVLHDGEIDHAWSGSGTICDSLSNLLFYNTYRPIYTSQHNIMENGQDFDENGPGNQSNLIVPWPESDSLYFVFKISDYDVPGGTSGLNYNIVDINENSGLGAVVLKDIILQDAAGVNGIMTAAKHKNKRDIWIITRDFKRDKYIVFLITPDGINETAVKSDAPNVSEQCANNAYMKLSFDKKYLLTTFQDYIYDRVEISKFNTESGEVEWQNNHENDWSPVGLEFSPDSKFVYISYIVNSDSIQIRQYEMQNIEDPLLFSNSAIIIGGNIGRGLQLATDGKIYCITREDYFSTSMNYFVGAIHEPWKSGLECNYQEHAINMAPRETSAAIPNILLDYLYRFDFDGICEGDQFQFTSFFNPVPDSIRWDFNDFGSGINTISYELNPIHIFSDGGTYEVEADVWYPSGRYEHTSREVKVEYSPEPDLGADTTICNAADIILNAECGPHSYFWSNGNFGTSHITVSDTGWFWVKVSSNGGCIAYDSIHISKFGSALADTTNLILSPTTCGGSTGAIRGLEITGIPPFSYQWVNDLGNPVANTIDMYQLPVGNYTLQVTDSNDCVTELGPYSIIDVGEVLVEGVSFHPEHCNQSDGSIIVTATSGLGDMLYYSIDNGASYFQNLGVFTGLSGGVYAVKVHDSTWCGAAYVNNPIIIDNTQGPEITNVIVTPASIGQDDGSINIIASSQDDTLYFSNDAGTTYQINNGLFSNLQGGFYTCVVTDEHGCDTTFIIEVMENITVRLQAIAGDDQVCPGLSAYVPLTVNNFDDVAEFNITLTFDETSLICQGFSNAHQDIEDSLQVFLFPAEGKVELKWSSIPISLPANANIAELVFETINMNGSSIEWEGSPGISWFLNSTGISIPVDYTVGEVKLYNELVFSILPNQNVCEGDMINLHPVVWSYNGSVTYLWSLPNGDTSTSESIIINQAQQSQAGNYSIKVTDTANCYKESVTVLNIYESPKPEFAVQDTIFTVDPIELDAGAGFASYWWNNGDITQTSWANTQGWYLAQVESVEGCIGEDSSYVFFSTPAELINVYFPNAFTPNGDGLNDEFKVIISSPNIEAFSMSVFNRWGAIIFHTNDISLGWDGTYQGKMCTPGSYVFKISYNTSINSNTQPEAKIGTVMLVN